MTGLHCSKCHCEVTVHTQHYRMNLIPYTKIPRGQGVQEYCLCMDCQKEVFGDLTKVDLGDIDS